MEAIAMKTNAIKKHEFPALKFKGRNFILVGDKTTGAIYDPEMFKNFGPSFMRLFSDGTIRRGAEIIGTKHDIEWINEIPLEIL